MTEFFNLYDELRKEYPLYMTLKHINRHWRIEVYGKQMAHNGSDASILTAEHESRAQCFIDAEKQLKGSSAQLENLLKGSELYERFKHNFL